MLSFADVSPFFAIFENLATFVYGFFITLGELFAFPASNALSTFNTSFISPFTSEKVVFSFVGNEWIIDIIDTIVDIFSALPSLIIENTGIEMTFGLQVVSALIPICLWSWILKILLGIITK